MESGRPYDVIMVAALSKKEHAGQTGPKHGWWRRLRTCGIVVIVATTVLVAAVYAMSWSNRLFLEYVAVAPERWSLIEIVGDRGRATLSIDPIMGRPKPSSGRYLFAGWESSTTGRSRTVDFSFPNLAWLAMNWPGPVSLRLEIPLAVLVATSAWLIARRVRVARAARKGGCSQCGYDLTGLPRQSDGSAGVCPECGQTKGRGAAA